MHVIFLDYDGCPYNLAADHINHVQAKHRLGRAYIFQTRRRGYHAIIPEKFPLAQAYQISLDSGSDTSHADAYKKNNHRCWVLRSGPKGNRPAPRYVGYLEGVTISNVKSLGHLEYLLYAGVPREDIVWEPNDGYHGWRVHWYRTKHY